MAIDMQVEDIVSFRELARAQPRRRGNRPMHVSTVHRWRMPGLAGGIRLEAIRIGGCWCTSWQAFERFCERLTAASTPDDYQPAAKTDTEVRQQGADAILEDGGW